MPRRLSAGTARLLSVNGQRCLIDPLVPREATFERALGRGVTFVFPRTLFLGLIRDHERAHHLASGNRTIENAHGSVLPIGVAGTQIRPS